jgi:(R,R)-butanediol dehydrogenase/meso-butanediol dehydrogenase/diacetyl reductase
VMQAVRWHDRGVVSLDQVPRPRLQSDNSVIAAVEGCGVCGTDVEEVQNGPKAIPVGQPHPLTGCSAPIVLGHEILGRVVDAGAATAVRIGERVAVWPQIPCRDCATCRAGDEHQCPRIGALGLSANGGFASHVVVDGRSAVPVDESLPLERAILVEPCAVALHAFERHPPAARTVMVLGIGSVGLALVETAVALGARRVVAVSRNRENLEAALRAGASLAVLPGEAAEHAVDIAVDASGGDQAMMILAGAVRPLGTAILVGVRSPVVQAPIWEIFRRELTFVGSNGVRLAEFERAVQMIAAGQIGVAPRRVRAIRLADLPAALRKGPPGPVKLVAVPG